MCIRPGEKCGIPHEYGVFYATQVAAKHAGVNLKEARVAINGFGNVSSSLAKYLSDYGAKIVAVSDSKGCIYNPDGLDYGKLKEVKRETRTVINYSPGHVLKNEEIFELPVDILIPASIPEVINERNVDKIQAKIIVEAANIPATHETERKLHERGILVVPDFVANAGGVVSSCAKYIGENPERMLEMVKERMVKNTNIVLKEAEKGNIPPRDVALKIAQERVRKAMMEK